jgi:hypothetical protein
MSDIAAGSLVKHVSLGIGKVVAVEATAVHVFFPESEKRYAAKLRWPAAGPLLTKDGVEPNAWLESLTSFALDETTGRYALAANFLSHDEAVAQFLESYPQGFPDPAHAEAGAGKRERAPRWRAANAEWIQAFGGGQGERLVADGELRELVRRALRVGAHVTRIPGMIEQEALEEALEPGDLVAAFFDALFGVLSAPSPIRARAEKLFAASDALGVPPEFAWPMATSFPFIADPVRQVILLPKSACGAATRLGCDLRFKSTPNWATYAALRDFSTQLLVKLQPSGARDFIDVESFLHATAVKRPPAAGHRAKPTARSMSSTPARARHDDATVAASRRKR